MTSKNSIRHTTRNKEQIPTHSPPPISIPELDKRILRHLFENERFRFNIREFSKINKIPRTNIYDSLSRLNRYEFVDLNSSDKKISAKGRIYAETISKGYVGNSRWECRDLSQNLSTHYHKFKLHIIDRSKFSLPRLRNIPNKGLKENSLHNLYQIIVDFDDAKVIINPKQIIISLFEVQTKDTEESDIKCLSRVIEYTELLKNIGLETEGMIIESGEWARVESQLANFLYKIDKRYYLNLSDGSKFWIDFSGSKSKSPEDETNNKEVRTRIDSFIDQIGTGKFSFTELMSEVQNLKNFSISAVKEQIESIKQAHESLIKLSDQNIQITQVIEQISNNQIRITKEIFKNK
jgi:hypothetical protein